MGPTGCLSGSSRGEGEVVRVVSWVFVAAALVLLLAYFSRPERLREVVQSVVWLKAVLKILLVHGV
ncbi:MAG: hypothetical protein ABSG98_07620 [Anaerolineales bacterium]